MQGTLQWMAERRCITIFEMIVVPTFDMWDLDNAALKMGFCHLEISHILNGIITRFFLKNKPSIVGNTWDIL